MKYLAIAKVEYTGRIVNREQKRYFPVVDIVAWALNKQEKEGNQQHEPQVLTK